MHKSARTLAGALKRGDTTSCRSVCMRLAGTAQVVGFAQIGSLAEKASQTLISASVGESARSLRALIGACERARAA